MSKCRDLLFGDLGFFVGLVGLIRLCLLGFGFGTRADGCVLGDGVFGDEAAERGKPFGGLEAVADGGVAGVALQGIYKELGDYFAVSGESLYGCVDGHAVYYSK